MTRRPCRRSEPSSSDAEEVSVFDRSRQGSVTTVDKDMALSTMLLGKQPTGNERLTLLKCYADDALCTYTYWTEYI